MRKRISNPLVSVIIPTYNRQSELRRCLDSLVKQTLGDFEVLVCDDGSTDNTVAVINDYVSALDITYDYAENFEVRHGLAIEALSWHEHHILHFLTRTIGGRRRSWSGASIP